MIEFKYELDKILSPLPENITGTMKGSIIAKADKMDQDIAMDFIDEKVKDGTIDEETKEKLYRLLKYFCVYR
jgi:ATP-dependent helicase/DNAse subunit B